MHNSFTLTIVIEANNLEHLSKARYEIENSYNVVSQKMAIKRKPKEDKPYFMGNLGRKVKY